MNILDKFAENFQKGGIPFLIFIGLLAYATLRLLKSILPDPTTPESRAQTEIVEGVSNQTGVKGSISTQDKIIADRLFTLCDGWYKDEGALEEALKYFTSATITKRVFAAYGIRSISVLWFEPVKKNLVLSILDKFGTSTDIGKKAVKIFQNANLS